MLLVVERVLNYLGIKVPKAAQEIKNSKAQS
jgi:hypothetical protein